MPDSPFVLSPLAAAFAQPRASAFALTPAAAAPVFVELSKTAKKADIVREGFGVAEAKVAPLALERWLGGIGVQRPQETPRVVSSSIEAHKKVPVGTAVDLVLAPRKDIPLDIFEGVHVDLRQRTVGSLLEDTMEQEANKQALRIVLAKDSEEELSASEKQVVTTMLQAANVTIDDTDADKSFGAAFRALRFSSAFR